MSTTSATSRPEYVLRLAKEDFKFSAAHFTLFGPDEAELLHGHNYQVEVEMVGYALDEDWQFGLRFQDAEDAASTKSSGLAVNWFPFDAPVALLGEVTSYDRDDENGILARIGFSYGTTRHDEPVFPR